MIHKFRIFTFISILAVAGLVATLSAIHSMTRSRIRNSYVPADWPTYTNSKYSFKFRYPSGWDIHSSSGFDTPWSVQLFPPTASTWPITIFTNLGYDTPSEAATVWSNTRQEYRGSEQFRFGQISGYKISEAKDYVYLHYYFKGPRTPTLELITPLFMPNQEISGDRQKLVEQILSTLEFK